MIDKQTHTIEAKVICKEGVIRSEKIMVTGDIFGLDKNEKPEVVISYKCGIARGLEEFRSHERMYLSDFLERFARSQNIIYTEDFSLTPLPREYETKIEIRRIK